MNSLTAADLKSGAWRKFVSDQQARLQELREQNDQQSLDPVRTAAIRGQIAEVKRTLDLSPDSSTDESHPALRGADE